MKSVSYVLLSPTGNLTALVLSPHDPADETEITRRLMEVSEQVAFLDPPSLPASLASVRLMGGEFCGNAAMAAAGWIIRERLGASTVHMVPLEVSGAQGLLFCRIRGLEKGFGGTVEMPSVQSVREEVFDSVPLTAVHMEGIVHYIRESSVPMEKQEAESLLKALSERTEEKAVGLLDWNPETGALRPLVLVKASRTLVWETACGSGSAAVGALAALRREGSARVRVSQPGGVIEAEALAREGKILSLSITGTVIYGPVRSLRF